MIMVTSYAQQRPFIWVTQSERDAILEKIEQYEWADSLFDRFSRRLDVEFTGHQLDAHEFLSGLPFDVENAGSGITPPFLKVDYSVPGQDELADVYMQYLQVGIDCGVFYYLTLDERYAQCALDILNAFIFGISQLDLDEDTGNGGWLYSNGQHLREAREIGAQIPIIYDFVFPYIISGGKPYDIGQQASIEFPHEMAQQLFRTYADLVINRGHTGSNWSVLESSSLVQNSLALEDESERDSLLQFYLTKATNRQDPLSVVAMAYKYEGDVWPESPGYSNHVAHYTTYLLTMITRYDSSLHLGRQYKNIPMALARWDDMKFPNEQVTRFGDAGRSGGPGMTDCEVAYFLGKLDSVPEMVERYGEILNTAIGDRKYNRGSLGGRPLAPNVYFEPLRLLWNSGEITGGITKKQRSRTDHLRHASLYLQRNLSKTEDPKEGLMCFMAGAAMVHGHASGIDMELYGKGQVLGIDGGRGTYQTDVHENYYRLFAAHNNIIVNGSSQSDGSWVQLGTNPVQLVSMEPKPGEEAVSPDFSFTQASFVDDKGSKAEAVQQRTMSIVRTSPTTGYYFDLFRSKSSLPNEYHDYVYHNIGDKVEFLSDGMELKADPDRYMANANNTWIQNRQYRHPGWHFFDDVETSSIWDKSVNARFSVEKFSKPIYMNLYIPGDNNREYTRVKAPRDKDAPAAYRNEPVPVILIRKTGEAWDRPFLVVYEPSNHENSSVKSVHPVYANHKVVGAEVRSAVSFTSITDYIISADKDEETFILPGIDIQFEGRFGIVRVENRGDNERVTLYIGDGKELIFAGDTLTANESRQGLKVIGELEPIVEIPEDQKSFIRIEAEDYDEGGEGVAYHDYDVGNAGGAYRDDDVDIVADAEASNGFAVTYFKGSDWMKYSFEADSSFNYEMTYFTSCPNKDSSFVEFTLDDSVLFNGKAYIARTNNWSAYEPNRMPDSVYLEKGTHVLKIKQGMSLSSRPDKVEFNFGDIPTEIEDTVTNIRPNDLPNSGYFLSDIVELTVSGENGTVTVSPDKQPLLIGDELTLQAIPGKGYQFVGWTGDVTSPENPLTITINSSMQISANFSFITGVSPEDNLQNLSVYPNPSKGIFTVEVPEGAKGVYSVYSSIGRRLKEGDFFGVFHLDISDQPESLYFLKIWAKNCELTKMIEVN